MKARLLILIVLAGGVAVWAAFRSPPPPKGEDDGQRFMPADTDVGQSQVREAQKMLWERHLPGVEPPEEVDLSISVEVDTSTGKNRLVFYISEAHGYYVEDFNIQFWYTGGDDSVTPSESPLSLHHRAANRFLEANSTLKECIELVPGETRHIGYDIGGTKDWAVEIIDHGRARAKNPDPLPTIANVPRCD